MVLLEVEISPKCNGTYLPISKISKQHGDGVVVQGLRHMPCTHTHLGWTVVR